MPVLRAILPALPMCAPRPLRAHMGTSGAERKTGVPSGAMARRSMFDWAAAICAVGWAGEGLVRRKQRAEGQRPVRLSLRVLPDRQLSQKPISDHRRDEDHAEAYTFGLMAVCTRPEARIQQRVSTSIGAAHAASTRASEDSRSLPQKSAGRRWGRRGKRQARGKETRRSTHGVPQWVQAATVSRRSRRRPGSLQCRRRRRRTRKHSFCFLIAHVAGKKGNP